MTKTIDISQDQIECARRLTHAETDEDAIRLAIKAFNARGESLDEMPESIAPFSAEQRARLDALRAKARVEAAPLLAAELAKRRDQTSIIPLLGTFDSLVSDEEFDIIRGRKR